MGLRTDYGAFLMSSHSDEGENRSLRARLGGEQKKRSLRGSNLLSISLQPSNMPTYLTVSSELEAERLGVLCATFPQLSVDTCRRFLRARKWDVHKAQSMLQADVEWRAEKRPNDIMQADLLHSLPAGAWRAVGVHQTADEALPVRTHTRAQRHALQQRYSPGPPLLHVAHS
eukprot:scaffold297510_cov43-Tisochrysis_lutea.AAC.3